MNAKQFKQHGIEMKLEKHGWRVTMFERTVASGSIPRKTRHARNTAREDMLKAAHVAFVIARIKGNERPQIDVTKMFGVLSAQTTKAWARMLYDEISKEGFMSRILKIKSDEDQPIKIERIEPKDMYFPPK